MQITTTLGLLLAGVLWIGPRQGDALAAALRHQGGSLSAADLQAIAHGVPPRRRCRAVRHTPDMDGFGSQSLKRSSYRAVMRQPLQYAGIKLFCRQDSRLFTPAQVM
jgi:hypothetical protein